MMLLFAAVISIPLGLDLLLPAPEDNPVTLEKVALGRRLFFDRRLSRDESMSCASCHDPTRAFADDKPLAIGIHGRRGSRNAPALINRGYGALFFWDGRSPTLEKQVLEPILNPKELDLTIDELEGRTNLGAGEIARALATYVRTILSGDSPFDRYMDGDRAALSEQARRGLDLFRGKAGCITCHVGPNFTDERFHNTGVAWRGGRLLDEGRGAGQFKTPTLREVARTAPYMHDGSLSTIEDVIEYYDRGGNANPNLDSDLQPRNLTLTERQSLAVFLRSLSGRLVEGGKTLD